MNRFGGKIKRVPIDIYDNQHKNNWEIMEGAGKTSTKGINSFAKEHNKVEVEVRNKNTGKVEDILQGNLITYRGRAWLAQRAFNLNMGVTNRTNNDSTSVVTPGYNNKYISLLGVGLDPSGGECALDPTEVYESDYQLVSQGTVWDSGSINSGNFRYADVSNVYRQYHAIDTGYPTYLDDWNVSGGGTNSGYVKDPRYDSYMDPTTYTSIKIDAYLKVLCRITITPVECNGPKFYNNASNGEYYQDINEFGLFAAPFHNYQDSNYVNYKSIGSSNVYTCKKYRPEMFARVTTPTIRKDESMELVINWYVYF